MFGCYWSYNTESKEERAPTDPNGDWQNSVTERQLFSKNSKFKLLFFIKEQIQDDKDKKSHLNLLWKKSTQIDRIVDSNAKEAAWLDQVLDCDSIGPKTWLCYFIQGERRESRGPLISGVSMWLLSQRLVKI